MNNGGVNVKMRYKKFWLVDVIIMNNVEGE